MDAWTGGPGFELGPSMINVETEDARVEEDLGSLKLF